MCGQPIVYQVSRQIHTFYFRHLDLMEMFVKHLCHVNRIVVTEYDWKHERNAWYVAS